MKKIRFCESITSFTSKVLPSAALAVPVNRPGISSLGPKVGVRAAVTVWPATVAVTNHRRDFESSSSFSVPVMVAPLLATTLKVPSSATSPPAKLTVLEATLKT